MQAMKYASKGIYPSFETQPFYGVNIAAEPSFPHTLSSIGGTTT